MPANPTYSDLQSIHSLSMKHIVIIGAGAAGVGIAQGLDKSLDATKHTLTLLSQTDYYRHHPAALRPLVTTEGELEKDICLPYDNIFGKNMSDGKGRVGIIKIAKVASVEENTVREGGNVVLANGDRLPWDILVVTTGSIWNGPLMWPEKSADVAGFLKEWRSKFAKARSIVLVGGGSVGFELAGEILDFHPQTKVSLVHRDSLPLNGVFPDAARHSIARGLEERGAQLVLGDSIALTKNVMDGSNPVIPGGTITTAKGVTLPAELVIATLGVRGVFTSFLNSFSSPMAPTINNALHTDGHLLVKPTFQLMTNSNVFAAGDVVALPEQHSLVKVHAHGPIAVANILAVLKEQETKVKSKTAPNLKEYRGASESLVITNGRVSFLLEELFTWTTLLSSGGLSFLEIGSAVLKSKSLFVGAAKALVNQ